jgi:polyvinyl alcohol dehydrogenase (cytochrome)
MKLRLASKHRKLILLPLLSLLAPLIFTFASNLHTTQAASSGASWPMFMSGASHTGFNKAETIINKASASNLKQHWSYQTGGAISSQPVEANGLVYWGSWDGNEYATDQNGNKVWATNLGRTASPGCKDTTGVASTANIVNINIGTASKVLFVGGGDASVYALNASNGAVLWRTALGSPPNTFIWSSPTYDAGYLYIGVSSFGSCPNIQGKLAKLNAVTGQIVSTFSTVPDGCTGGSVWSSPSLDQSTGMLYFTTGNIGTCSTAEPHAIAVMKLRASDLSLISYWQVPADQQRPDGDFGATATLFKAMINGVAQPMVGAINKNGTFYAFKRNNISQGPFWSIKLGNGGSCPQCGTANISSAAWDGARLYVATGINGQGCPGSLQALNPTNGLLIWQQCLHNGHVLAPVSTAPGVVVATAGTDVIVNDSASGQNLMTLTDTNSGSLYYGAASISRGVLYVGNMDGILHAYGL